MNQITVPKLFNLLGKLRNSNLVIFEEGARIKIPSAITPPLISLEKNLNKPFFVVGMLEKTEVSTMSISFFDSRVICFGFVAS